MALDPLSQFGISVGVSLGSRLLGALFGGGDKRPWTTNEINKLETFDKPSSQYGDSIPEIYGRVRVPGVYVAASDFDWERDDYRNGETKVVELTYVYYGNLGVMWGIVPLKNNFTVHKIYFNKRAYYAGGNIDALLGEYWGRFAGLELRNYDGSQTNLDSYLGFLGSNHTSFRNTSYTAMKRLRLNNSDGGLFEYRYPNLEAEIITHNLGASLYLGDVIANLLSKAGYDPSEYDVSELNQQPFRGFITTTSTLSEKLGKLQAAYFFEICDTGDKLKFITTNRPATSATIPNADLGTSEGDDQGELFTENDEDLTALPTRFEINFNDYDDDYQPNIARSFDLEIGDWQNIETIDTGLTLTASEATAIANKLLVQAWQRRKTYRFYIPPKYQGLEAGDQISVELRPGSQTPLQIRRLNQSPSGVIEVEGYPTDATGSPPPVSSPPTVTPTPPPASTQVDLRAIQIKPSATENTGIYLFAHSPQPWQSAILWGSSDGVNYTNLGPIFRSTFGTANTNNLSSETIPDTVDSSSTITVTVEPEMLPFPASGRLLVGEEIIEYSNAQQGTTTVTLSGLTRCLEESTGDGHGSSEDYYLLSGYKFFVAIAAADAGTTRYFKAVSSGQTLNSVTSISITIAEDDKRTEQPQSTQTFGTINVLVPTDSTRIRIPCPIPLTINSLFGCSLEEGSCTLSVKIYRDSGNEVFSPDGLASVSVSAVPNYQTIETSNNNEIQPNDLLVFEFSNTVGAKGFHASLVVTLGNGLPV